MVMSLMPGGKDDLEGSALVNNRHRELRCGEILERG